MGKALGPGHSFGGALGKSVNDTFDRQRLTASGVDSCGQIVRLRRQGYRQQEDDGKNQDSASQGRRG